MCESGWEGGELESFVFCNVLSFTEKLCVDSSFGCCTYSCGVLQNISVIYCLHFYPDEFMSVASK